MSNTPADRKYAKSHEWVFEAGDGVVAVGISDYAQDSLGDITYVQLPNVGDALAVGEVFGVVESVKAASDLYAPVSGEVVAVNDALDSTPENVNQDPYGEGWIMKLKLADAADLDGLLDADGYTAENS
ncbi:glycine cleavage system protein GcvH [Synoicihabitans lomoniglobus]|uniref:Glycine cleavage system H protein n=1 Tax=Synoicihabitans lomoniglobus TaxID=2909285 RepID=A0AAF0I4E4_9BACT|nr:glycine cleavage system protein GcvH [Opitutaceae bacterium LMO-M01]WED66734.1 glycine cleavage system protein GcvH [Opitutaceae bacterium LMO-M01]